jgi:hypothetical protein
MIENLAEDFASKTLSAEDAGGRFCINILTA